MQRCVAHLDMDAFYVGVELMRRPELRGRPVVVAGTGPRAVVTTASYEARRYGVFSAIPAARARRLCPEAIFLPPDFDAYRAMSRRVMDRVRAQVDTVEVAGLDEAYLDLSGIYSPRAAMRRLVSEIKADTGLGCSVGIGPNRLVAKVASDAEKPEGFVVLTREQACERFAGARRGCCPGSGRRRPSGSRRSGSQTIAQLAATPPATLAERFGGRLGPYLCARARFEDDSPITVRAHRGLGVARDDLPDRRRRPRRAGQPSCGGSRASCARGWPSTTAAGARSPSRSASTTSRPSPAPARSRRRPTTPRSSPTSPARCCDEYAPAAARAAARGARGRVRRAGARRTATTRRS